MNGAQNLAGGFQELVPFPARDIPRLRRPCPEFAEIKEWSLLAEHFRWVSCSLPSTHPARIRVPHPVLDYVGMSVLITHLSLPLVTVPLGASVVFHFSENVCWGLLGVPRCSSTSQQQPKTLRNSQS